MLVELRAASLRVNNGLRTAKLGYQTIEGKTCVEWLIRETIYRDNLNFRLEGVQLRLLDPDATLTTQLWDVMKLVVNESHPDSREAGAWGEVTIDVLQGWIFLHHRARRITYEWSDVMATIGQAGPAASAPAEDADDPRP